MQQPRNSVQVLQTKAGTGILSRPRPVLAPGAPYFPQTRFSGQHSPCLARPSSGLSRGIKPSTTASPVGGIVVLVIVGKVLHLEGIEVDGIDVGITIPIRGKDNGLSVW